MNQYYTDLESHYDEEIEKLLIYGQSVQNKVRMIIGVYAKDTGLKMAIQSYKITLKQRDQISQMINEFNPERTGGSHGER